MRKFFSRVWKIIIAPFVWLANLITHPFRAVYRFMMIEPESHSMGEIFDALSTSDEARSHLIQDLEKLRWHILRSLLALFISAAVAWYYITPIIEFLAVPVGGVDKLQTLDLTESIGVYMKIAFMTGFAASIVYIAFELWLYAAPGLKVKARWSSLGAIPLSAIFFWAGVWFTNDNILPTAINFLINFGDFQAHPTAEKYFSLITRLLFWIGLFFEFPMVAVILTRMKIITYKTLFAQWRLAVIIIGVIAAVVTPTTDWGSMAIVMAPMIALYFIGVGLSFIFRRKLDEPALT